MAGKKRDHMASMTNRSLAFADAMTSSVFFGVDGEGLFAQDGLAVFQAEQGGLFVLRVGGGDVDDVDVRVGGQRLVARRGAGVAPNLSAKASAFSWEREPTATSLASPTDWRPVANWWAMLPGPRMPQPMVPEVMGVKISYLMASSKSWGPVSPP